MVIDASVWIGRFLPEDAHHARSAAWFSDAFLEEVVLASPITTLAEVAGAIARRTGSAHGGREASLDLRGIPGLRLVQVDGALADQASDIAADHRLRGADAFYVAVAVRLGMPLVTFDDELASRAAAVVRVLRPQ